MNSGLDVSQSTSSDVTWSFRLLWFSDIELQVLKMWKGLGLNKRADARSYKRALFTTLTYLASTSVFHLRMLNACSLQLGQLDNPCFL